MVNIKSKIGGALLVMVALMLAWYFFNARESAAKVDSLGGSSDEQVSSGSTQEARKGRRSGRQRAGVSDAELSEFPKIDEEEVNRLLASGEVLCLEIRGPGGSLVDPHEPLAAVLKLNKDEVDALNKLWLRIRPKLNDLRARHVKQQIMEDGEVWVGVEVFSEEGDVLRQAFISDVLGMIGEQRGGLFLQGLNAHAAYGRWGKVVGSGFSIRVVEQSDGSLIYQIKEPTKESGVPGRTWRTSRMPEHLKFLSDALEISPTP